MTSEHTSCHSCGDSLLSPLFCFTCNSLQIISDEMPKPRTLYGAWKEMRQTWRKQQFEPWYEFDTPLPDKQRKNSTYTEDPLSFSIGDLAPKSLT